MWKEDTMINNERRKEQVNIDDIFYRITPGPASYHGNIVRVVNTVVHVAETLEQARDMADAINRALAY